MMYEKIYDTLVDANIKPYSIGQHNGECNSPYVVISNAGTNPFSVGLKYDIIDIIIYYPIGAYSKVEPYANKVKQALKKIKNLKYTNTDTPIVIDDDKKAYTQSFTYQVYKRKVK
ncbi:hypothetical protein [Paraclostridium sordellii]|uniref:hypothetical protein n=1 Tax=Paraclostridium sordellii TaxID=1505 RepID=UPI0018CE24BB|nr:hypothetical protein [Paeniclostridium sordellii]